MGPLVMECASRQFVSALLRCQPRQLELIAPALRLLYHEGGVLTGWLRHEGQANALQGVLELGVVPRFLNGAVNLRHDVPGHAARRRNPDEEGHDVAWIDLADRRHTRPARAAL